MRRLVVTSTAVFVVTAGAAAAADMPRLSRLPPAAPVIWNWTGPYWGVHVGGSFGSSNFDDSAGPGIYGGSVRSPAALAGIQLGYNLQRAHWVFGVEADISAVNANGTNTCLASSGAFISANCRVRQDALATLTGRAGFAAGPGGRTLLYAKGGAAFLAERIDIAANSPLESATDATAGRFGWTAGAGIETALAPAWSVKLEYNYANFGSRDMATPDSYRWDAVGGWVPTPQGSSRVSQDLHAVKLGLNLKLGGDTEARFEDYHLRGSQSDDRAPIGEVEIGGRVWYSAGRFQKDLGNSSDPGHQNVLISRLTYQSDAASGELFGRIDGPHDLFLKGFAGGGKLVSGRMNDEDWIANDGIPYSNTLSDPVKGSIAYATLDAGYDLLRGPGYKFGGFVGYNYYREAKAAYGCVQNAGPLASAACGSPIPNSVLAITENDTWHSLRVGLNGEVALGRGVKLSADAAYLPYVKFFGEDNHVLRRDVSNTLSPERATGQGVQLEAILSYQFSNAFSLGAGARYWAMWATTDAYTNIFGTACPCQTLPVRTERYGTFLQAAYKFDSLK
ncbi:outer membrane beta-barrel protein [Rhodopseudomonas telluris]|uniref:Outer membrane beta-barrel protein n=1 Tax=Rhodopseudomonas telluris TaxID=644215 RepID=A0ABV6ERQ0_9BRAD